MATTKFTKTRVYQYMSKMWQEHQTLFAKQCELEESVTRIKLEIRNLERRWWQRLTGGDVRLNLKKLKIHLISIIRRLSKIVDRCTSITKTTSSWANAFQLT